MPRILIIEDDSLLIDFLKESLKHQGFEVITANNGQKGIRYAHDKQPDLIISDINMPGMSGYDVLKHLQRDANTSNIPFIFLTGKIDMEDLREGMSLGADDYLMKPVVIAELIKAVKTRLKKHRDLTKKYREEITRTMLSLEKTINYDEITGLPKRVLLEKKIKKLKFERTFDETIALMIIRFDRFRGIADMLGKSAINLLIERLADVIQSDFEIFWLDSDEYGILIFDNTEDTHLRNLADQLLKNIRRTFLYNDQELHFSASIGITRNQIKSINFTRLLSEAELALNYAVEQGYSNFQFFDAKMRKHVFQNIRLEGALHRAVEHNELLIYYQPKFQLSDEKLVGIEALVRWDHAEFGMISPSQFIPIAEKNGLINEIGDWITSSICKQITAWKKQGISIPRVAINVSGGQLEKHDFYERISIILSESGISGHELEFELTESILVRNSKETIHKLSEFKKLGINISIDDFGTGYSSLQYLKNFPHDKIKIDQSFIRDLTVDKNSASIVTTIIAMAHKLGVRVIAEGVENEEQVNFLRQHNCDEIQGFFYSKPVSADHLTEVMANYN
jgi:diguanylate cyclase (GGDEF)-like protein